MQARQIKHMLYRVKGLFQRAALDKCAGNTGAPFVTPASGRQS